MPPTGGKRLGATNTVSPSRPFWVSPASSACVSRSSTVTPVGQRRGVARCRRAARPSTSCTSPSASTATTAPFDARSVVFTRSRMRRIWRRPRDGAGGRACRRELFDQRVELGPDDLGAVLHVVARGRDLGAARQPGGDGRGEDEHAERDRHHRDEQARARSRAPGHGSRRGRRPRCLEAVADTAHGRDDDAVAELLAHLRDVHVDGAGVAEPVVAPHAVEDLLARQREAGALGEEAQEVELLGGELDRGVVDQHLAAPARRR